MTTTKKTRRLPPDPERMNKKRASWANRAIDSFRTAKGADEENALPDLLADLMHWADRNDQDFDTALARAFLHYDDETSGVGARKPIVIEVLGGNVQDVLNVPPGYNHEIRDYDNDPQQGSEAL